MLLAVLRTVCELLRDEKTATQREIYYMHKNVFATSVDCSAAIQRVCAMLGVPRHSLGIVATSRYRAHFAVLLCCVRVRSNWSCRRSGYFAGCLEMKEGRSWTNYKCRGPSSIFSGVVDTEVHVRSTARFIVVIEKDCKRLFRRANVSLLRGNSPAGIFQRLVEDKVFDTIPCVLVTGCGYPDLATR
jgi:meiotic recombination protein SPO11